MFVASIVKIKTINKDVCAWQWVGTDKLFTQVGLHYHQSTDKNVCIVYDQS